MKYPQERSHQFVFHDSNIFPLVSSTAWKMEQEWVSQSSQCYSTTQQRLYIRDEPDTMNEMYIRFSLSLKWRVSRCSFTFLSDSSACLDEFTHRASRAIILNGRRQSVTPWICAIMCSCGREMMQWGDTRWRERVPRGGF